MKVIVAHEDKNASLSFGTPSKEGIEIEEQDLPRALVHGFKLVESKKEGVKVK